MIVSTAAMCLALNIYHEARGEPIMGQYAVALVTMNRAKQDPEQVCRETFRRKQFSWANVRVRRVPGGWALPPGLRPKDAYAWWKAERVAAMTLEGRMWDFTGGATFYHTKAVKPGWTWSLLSWTRDVGFHRFYSLRRQSAVTASL